MFCFPHEAKMHLSAFWQGTPEDVGRGTPENKIVIDRNALIPKMLTLKVGDEFCGVVAHIQTPEDFFCQQLQSGRESVFFVPSPSGRQGTQSLCLRCDLCLQTSLRSFRNPSVNTVAKWLHALIFIQPSGMCVVLSSQVRTCFMYSWAKSKSLIHSPNGHTWLEY